MGGSAEHTNPAIFLLKCGELVEHGLNFQGGEKRDDVVLNVFKVADVVVDRAVHDRLLDGYLQVTEHLCNLGVALVTARQEKFFLFVALDVRAQFRDRLHAIKHLAFTELDKLLQVVGNGLRGAEVLHILRHLQAHFAAESKKVVHRVFTGKNDGGIIVRIDAVFAVFPLGQPFNGHEGHEIYTNAKAFLQVVISGALSGRGLGDEDVVDFSKLNVFQNNGRRSSCCRHSGKVFVFVVWVNWFAPMPISARTIQVRFRRCKGTTKNGIDRFPKISTQCGWP